MWPELIKKPVLPNSFLHDMAGALHELLLQVSNLFLTIGQLATGRLQLLVQVPNLVVPHLYFLIQRLDLLFPVPANDGLPLQLS